MSAFRDFDGANFERDDFDDTFSRPSNQVTCTPDRFFATMTQAMIFADSNGLLSPAHRASRRKAMLSAEEIQCCLEERSVENA